MLFQHMRYIKALSISMCRCICHVSSIVLFFITLAKRHRFSKGCVQGENALDLLNKENRCICMLNYHPYSTFDKTNNNNMPRLLLVFFFPNLAVYSTHIGISLNPASLKSRRLYCLLWQCDRSSRISTEENKLD